VEAEEVNLLSEVEAVIVHLHHHHKEQAAVTEHGVGVPTTKLVAAEAELYSQAEVALVIKPESAEMEHQQVL
jgi:hypothetical protein